MTYDVETLSGVRAWEYQPDFSTGYEIRRAFLTDITVSRSGRERRRAMRDAPRVSASFDSFMKADELLAAKRFLRAWQNQPTAVPDFSRYVATTGSSAFAASTLTIATPPAWISAGQIVAIVTNGLTELAEIDSVADPVVTLANPLQNAWPSGSIVRPVLHGLLDARLRGSRLTAGSQRISLRIDAYPGGEPPEDEGAAGSTFNGYEVFAVEPDFSQQPSVDYIWPVEQVDFGIGRTAQFRPIERQELLTEAQFSNLTPAAATAVEQTFLRAKGRRGAFYRSTCEKDMTLAANTSAVAYFDAVGTDLANDFGSIDYAANPTAIEIVETNGTRTRKLVTGITSVGGNSRVAFAGAISLTVAGTARISWLPLVRFASDELATVWRGPTHGSIRATFQTVRQ